MKVTLISTVYNEANNIGLFLDSLSMQTRLPDEVVICDAGSTDGTAEILKDFASKFSCSFNIIVEEGNRSHGRNTAIRHATHEIIAGTDAGCVLDPHWLERIISPFEKDSSVDVVSGFYSACGKTWFEKCVAVATLSTKGVDPETFLPSTRSIAFRRSAWEDVGGLPEHLEYAEDTKFGLDLRAAGKRFVFASDALVYWRPRATLLQVFNQSYNYARGNAEARILFFNYVRIHVRYLVWLVLSVGLFISPWFFALWIPAVVPYWLKWSLAGWRASQDLRSLLVTPWIKLIVDIGQFAGFWSGLCHSRQT